MKNFRLSENSKNFKKELKEYFFATIYITEVKINTTSKN